MKNIIVILLFFLFSAMSHGNGWISNARVASFYDVSKDLILVKFRDYEGNVNPNNCNPTESYHAAINPQERPVTMQHLTLAYYEENRVDVYITNGCRDTHWKNATFGNIGHIKMLELP